MRRTRCRRSRASFAVHPRLTLTGGLGYEFTTLLVDRRGRDSALLSLTDTAPTVGRLSDVYENISPRAAAAWDLSGDGSTSVRAGYGLYFTWSKTVDTTEASTFFSDATNGMTSAFPEFGAD